MEVPEPKRQRMGSVPEPAWTNGHQHRTTLPPISPQSYSHPSPHTHNRPPSSSHPHPNSRLLDDRRHHDHGYPTPLHEQSGPLNRTNVVNTYNGHEEPRTVPGDMDHFSYQRPNSTGHINDNHLLILNEDRRRHDSLQGPPQSYRTNASYIPHQGPPQHTVYDLNHGGYPPPMAPNDVYARLPPPFAEESPVSTAKPKKTARTSQV